MYEYLTGLSGLLGAGYNYQNYQNQLNSLWSNGMLNYWQHQIRLDPYRSLALDVWESLSTQERHNLEMTMNYRKANNMNGADFRLGE